MKQNKLYYVVVVICLIIISILITILVMPNYNMNKSHSHSHSESQSQNISNSKNIKTVNYPDYPNYDDIDYAYDYNGNWFQPSRWMNNIWRNNNDRNYYNSHMRNNYDRKDGLNIHNRYNFIHQQPVHQSQPNNSTQSIQPKKQHVHQQSQQSNQSQQPKIALIKQNFGSDFPFPTLTSSSNSMPEEIAMSPMQSTHIERGIHSISGFTSDLPMPFQTTDYNFNYNYKGPDMKNQKPFPVDMMASESIYLQPNTVANEIIIPPVVIEHPNPM